MQIFNITSTYCSQLSMMLCRVALAFVVMILSGCVQNPEGVLKHSASDKLFDAKGFDGAKRRPLYNKKYIARAKQNIIDKEFDDEDELDEIYNPAIYHREMYSQMVERDLAHSAKMKKKKSRYAKKLKNDVNEGEYPDLYEGDLRLKDIPRRDVSSVEQEVKALREMLENTKADLIKQQQETEKAQEVARNAAAKAQELALANAAAKEASVKEAAAKASAEEKAKKIEQKPDANASSNNSSQAFDAPQPETLTALSKASKAAMELEAQKMAQEQAEKEAKRASLKEKLLSDQSLLNATSDKDIASEVIKLLDAPEPKMSTSMQAK